ncbi:hypothetical protein V8G54_024853 [Vigna mungo]|uniref:Retroviral polymerase SH3-like domain-containing protein n=1 Tax=Vigna mungo TaxID=3915 RepID=A0AAQ3N708_VIGMU
MVFMGYHDTGAYKLYDPRRQRMVLSRDVVVLENECWDWNQNQSSMKKMLLHGLTNETALEEAETIADGNHDIDETSQRPKRQTMRPSKLSDYQLYSDVGVNEEGELIHMALMAGAELIDVDEALKQSMWRDAMIEELRSMEKNNTWRLVDLPPGKRCISVK